MRRRLSLLPVVLLQSASIFAATLRTTVLPVDGGATLSNPGCGFAGGSWTALEPGMSTNGLNLCANSANCTKLWSMHKFSKGYIYGDTYATQTNHYAHISNFVGGVDKPLDANALLSVSNSFLACRRNGGTCIPRFAYTWDGWGGAEPDGFDTILTHIRQLGVVLSQFRDVVPAIECGIIGAYGEMHTSRYTAKAYQDRVIGAWLDNLPTNMALLVRSPPVWMKYLNTTTPAFFAGGMESMDQVLRSRMGFFNDGYLGTDYDYGTWGGGGGSTSWSRSEGRMFLKNQAVPYGGEFASVSTNYFDENVHLLDPSKFNIVAEWYDTHLSYLRTIRSYNMTVVQNLTNTFFTSSRWTFDGMPNLSEYEGADLRKFCEDHMGFRFVVRDVSLAGRVGGARLDLEIENTGFGQLLFDDRIEIVLSGNGIVVAVPIIGEVPSLRTLRGGASAVYSLDFDYPANLLAGDYDVFLRVGTPLADEAPTGRSRRPVRFANKGGYDSGLAANFLCRVAIGGGYDFATGTLWFSWNGSAKTAYGGQWIGDAFSDSSEMVEFGIDSAVPSGASGEVVVDVIAVGLDEIPCPSGDMASFVFLEGESGEPIPYGYCANGWVRLFGYSPTRGRRAQVKMQVSWPSVRYFIDGTPLSDEAGRTWLPSAVRPRKVSRLSFVGEGLPGDFYGILGESLVSPFTIMLK